MQPDRAVPDLRRNSVFRGMGGAGISVTSTAGEASLFVEGSSFYANGTGVNVGKLGTATISRAMFFGSLTAGVAASTPNSAVYLSECVLSANNVAVFVAATAVGRLSNNDIVENATAVVGAWDSFGNNRFSGNKAAGSLPNFPTLQQ